MQFEFATATRIIFGPGTIEKVPSIAGQMAQRAVLVIGKDKQRAQSFLRKLTDQGLQVLEFQMPVEPDLALLKDGIEQARRLSCQLVIGLGGGSVLDTGKVIAAMLNNSGDLLDYLEVVGKGLKLGNPSAPYIAIPTTAGTGAEVTRNAVLAVPEQQVKVSMRSHFMLPCLAVVDPELTHSMPPQLTASTGLDALTQLLEAFVSNSANPLTDGLCREGLSRAGGSLRRAFQDGGDAQARENMSLASLLSGLALANAKLGAVHGLAGPLGGMIPAPHGVLCGRFLAWVMAANIKALRTRAPDSPALVRYGEVARILTGNPHFSAEDGAEWIKDLSQELGLPPLNEFGLNEEDFPAVVEKSRKASSMTGNPIVLADEELLEILSKAI